MSPTQEQVLALLSAGSTATAAAATAGVHRNTIANWRRTDEDFQQALQEALEDKAAFWREQAEQLANAAVEAIRAILTDGKAPASVRLKAALAILDKVTVPSAFSASLRSLREPPELAQPANPAPEPVKTNPSPEPVHNNAQSDPLNEAPYREPAAKFYANKPLFPKPTPPPTPKPGRNQPCPCGSGKKFKRCCLDAGHLVPGQAAA